MYLFKIKIKDKTNAFVENKNCSLKSEKRPCANLEEKASHKNGSHCVFRPNSADKSGSSKYG